MKDANIIKEFLKDHPNPKIVTASTIKIDCAVCIGPIPTICGAEIMCNPKSKDDLLKIVNNQ